MCKLQHSVVREESYSPPSSHPYRGTVKLEDRPEVFLGYTLSILPPSMGGRQWETLKFSAVDDAQASRRFDAVWAVLGTVQPFYATRGLIESAWYSVK